MDDEYLLPGSKKVEIVKRQEPHARRALESITRYGWYFDVSPTGTGKTVIALKLKQKLESILKKEVKLVIVGPASGRSDNTNIEESGMSPWRRETLTYKTGNFIFMAYSSIRGKTPDKNPTEKSPSRVEDITTESHGFIRRIDIKKKIFSADGIEKYKYIPYFEATSKWKEYCDKNNVLLIFDEAHNLKNDTSQNEACASLIKVVNDVFKTYNGGCYYGLLTATPFDKEKKARNFFQLIGIIDQGEVLGLEKGAAIDKIIFGCAEYDKEMTKKVMAESGLFSFKTDEYGGSSFTIHEKADKTKLSKFIFNLLNECIMSKVQSAMVDNSIRQVYRGFFNITRTEDIDKISVGVGNLSKAVEKVGDEYYDKNIKHKPKARGGKAIKEVKYALMDIESGIVNDMVRVGLKFLRAKYGCKIILSFNYLNSVKDAIEKFNDAGYNKICIISGKQTMKEKENYVRLFEEGRDYRIMIITTASGGTSIGLHDIIGKQKRFLLISPDHNMTNVHQTTGRIFRYGAHSIGEAYIFYAKGKGILVSSILESLAKKSLVMRQLLRMRESEKMSLYEKEILTYFVKLPGEYDRYIEQSDPKCENFQYIVDNQYLSNGQLFPKINEFEFIDIDNDIGRKNYKNTQLLIEYIEDNCKKNIKNIKGVMFKKPYPDDLDQYPNVPFFIPKEQLLESDDEYEEKMRNMEREKEQKMMQIIEERKKYAESKFNIESQEKYLKKNISFMEEQISPVTTPERRTRIVRGGEPTAQVITPERRRIVRREAEPTVQVTTPERRTRIREAEPTEQVTTPERRTRVERKEAEPTEQVTTPERRTRVERREAEPTEQVTTPERKRILVTKNMSGSDSSESPRKKVTFGIPTVFKQTEQLEGDRSLDYVEKRRALRQISNLSSSSSPDEDDDEDILSNDEEILNDEDSDSAGSISESFSD